MYGDFTGNMLDIGFDNHVAYMIYYHSKANYIKPIAIKSGTSPSDAYKQAYEFFESKGLRGDWFCTDNALSGSVKQWFEAKNVKVNLVPPHQHRANIAERMIQTWKAHFITILAGATGFPLKYWPLLTEQAEITINLLRPSGTDPQISAYERTHGEKWNFDKTPMMPPGTRCMILEPREVRRSYGAHATEAYYIGPAKDSYRCYKVVVPSTGAVRTSDSVEWFPADVIMPGATEEERLQSAIADLKDAIIQLDSTKSDLIRKSKPKLVAVLDELTDIYNPAAAETPCSHCGRRWNHALHQQWSGCSLCNYWVCESCTLDGKLKEHERTHTDAAAPATEGGLAPPPGFPPRPLHAQPPATEKTFDDFRGRQPAKQPEPSPQIPAPKPKQPNDDPGYSKVYKPRDRKPTVPNPPDLPAEGIQPQAPPKPIQPVNIGTSKRVAAKIKAASKADAKAAQTTPSNRAPPRRSSRLDPKTHRPSQPAAPKPTRNGKSAATAVSLSAVGTQPLSEESESPAALRPANARRSNPTKRTRGQQPQSRRRGKGIAQARRQARPTFRRAALYFGARAASEAESIWHETLKADRDAALNVDQEIGPTILDLIPQIFWGRRITARTLGAKVLDEKGNQLKYGKASKGDDAQAWAEANDLEWEKAIEKYQTMHFVDDVPKGRSPAYIRQVLEINKVGENRVRNTIGGDSSDLEFLQHEVASRNASVTAKKIFLNSILSEGLDFATGDLQDFYINQRNELAVPIYAKVRFDQLGPRTIKKYNLERLRARGWVVVKITKAVYGLEEASAISQNNLVNVLQTHGFYEQERGPKHMLFRHKDPDNLTAFVLHTDDFGIKFKYKHQAEALVSALHDAGYVIKMDWHPKKYCGITIDYAKGDYMHLSQPGYNQKLLDICGLNEAKLQYTPLPDVKPTYGKHTPMTEDPDATPPFTQLQRDTARKFLGGALFASLWTRHDFTYACNTLISEVPKGTHSTWQRILHFAGYIRAQPELGVTYYPSDMQLQVFTDSDFNSPFSRTGGFFHLGRKDEPDFINGPICCVSKLQPISSAAVSEAEYIAAFMNGKTALPLCHELDAHGYPQTAVLFRGDNRVCVGIATDTVQPKRSKYVDAKFHWFRDRVRRGDFAMTWIETGKNIADFFTKALAKIPFHEFLQFVAQTHPHQNSLINSE